MVKLTGKPKVFLADNLKQYMHRHHGRLGDFFCNFLATVLGILLTVGTTLWMDREQKKEAAESFVDRCMVNLDLRCSAINECMDKLQREDSLTRVILSVPVDSLSKLDLALLKEFYELLHTRWSQMSNHSVQTSFEQNVNCQDILGSFAEIVGHCFETIDYAEQLNREVNELKRDLERYESLEANKYDKTTSWRLVASMKNDPYFNYIANEISNRTNSLRRLIPYISNYIMESNRLWHHEITEEQFQTEVDKLWGSTNSPY